MLTMFYVELEPVFNNNGAVLPVEFDMSLSCVDMGISGITDGTIHVAGVIKNSTDIVVFSAKAEFTLFLSCDRCACEFKRHFSVPIMHTFVTELNDENNDNFIVIDGFHYDIEPVVREDILLAMPTKILCRDDCAGVCHRCGKNLNDGPCECTKEFDHRWDALSEFADEESNS